MKNKTLSIKLDLTTQEKKWGETESLGYLLDQAVDALDVRTANWVARTALKAFCREIVRTGGEITFPLEIRIISKRSGRAGDSHFPIRFGRN